MATLLVGFDSAWTRRRSGALVGVILAADGTFREIGAPSTATFPEAQATIARWQQDHQPEATVVMLDQPTIVPNATGQRPVENLVGGPVSRRYGGVQPSSTSRGDMFGSEAPLWPFLASFGGAADPRAPLTGTMVFETYPVLTLIALGWTRPDARPTGRLPKYNPERRKTFLPDDWMHVCGLLGDAFQRRGLPTLSTWCEAAAARSRPSKRDQDGVDAGLCLLAAIMLAEGQECLMVGDMATGYILVPSDADLRLEVEARCSATGRQVADWVTAITARQPVPPEVALRRK